MEKTIEKKKTWMKPRHRVITEIARRILTPIVWFKYRIRPEKFTEQGDRAYLILYNHQTAFDQFFVGGSFKGPVYYMATEDIFSLGWISKVLRWVIAPIPIRKQTTDITAVMNCIKVCREGGTIAIAPEGNRTYSGRTEYMNPAIAGLAKKLKLPIALYRIEDGYGVQLRWSDGTR
jgi:1-acyl-sn-glycerol-3-phosphate acyltransferase